ncbi:hypothetical protein, partial [Paenibacillus koleovorans]|uniref:hypothetical protein n=1 Tax=Paenibacillus koleovorans TaxID=121608 RepID=UPI0013E33717
MTFSVTVNDVLTSTQFDNKKDYIDAENPPVFYNTKVSSTAGDIKKVTDYTYNEARRWTTPIGSSSKTVNTSTLVESNPVTTSQTFDDYQNVTTSTDPMGVRTTYEYDATTHLLKSVSQPISATQTRYTGYTRNAQGKVT